MKDLVAVVIPVYKEHPDPEEVRSLKQCLKILHRYPLVFVAPSGLDMSSYTGHSGAATFVVERFDDRFFDGIAGYNQLMMDTAFYRRFAKFKYMLIYQLDAYVFKDELEYWCWKGYDYIGAPYIFVDLDKYPIKVFTKYRKLLKTLNRLKLLKHAFSHVGNGGFSLRHVDHTQRLLSILKRSAKNWPHNEDSFFTHFGNLLFVFYKIAPEKEALRFAFEEKPDQAYLINDRQLPFGCHAYIKNNDNHFWTSILEARQIPV
jgi:hypothetical protein